MNIKNLFNISAYSAWWSVMTVNRLQHKQSVHRQRDGKGLTGDEKRLMKDSIADVYEHANLVLISPDSKEHRSIRDELVSDEKRDKVHPLETMDDLVTYRLGDENSSKRAYALTVDMPGANPLILAVIYTHWSVQGHDSAQPDEALLPGNVADILSEPGQALDAEADTGIFYSISSFFPGAGLELIKKLRTEMGGDRKAKWLNKKRPVLSTLSPLRGFAKWAEAQELNIPEAPDLKSEFLRAAADNYLDANQDPVQKFHMGNGAYIGKVNLDANTPGTQDDTKGLGVMVNYVYPQGDILAKNQNSYKKEGKIRRSFQP